MPGRYYIGIILVLLMASTARGADSLVTICPSGCDYTQLEAAVNDNEQDLTALERRMVFQITGDWSGVNYDSVKLVVDNYTTNSDYYVYIYVDSEARHDGTAGSGYRLIPTSSGHCITVTEDYTYFEGLEVKSPGLGASNECFRLAANETTIKQCIIWTESATADMDGIYAGITPTTINVTVDNCIIYGFARAGIHAQPFTTGRTQTWTVRNCTIRDCGSSGEDRSGAVNIDRDGGSSVTFTVSNTIGMDTYVDYEDFSVADEAVYGDYAGDYNISSDTTSPGANSLDDRTSTADGSPGAGDWVIFTNLTGGSEDYHLQNVAENDAIDAGTDTAMPTDDIDWETRTGTWDVGADEFVSGAPAVTSPRRIKIISGGN